MWDYYQMFLIAPLVFTRLLLDEIYHLIELPFHWLIDDVTLVFPCLRDDLILVSLLQKSETGNWRIRTGIDYHRCITNKPINQVCEGTNRLNNHCSEFVSTTPSRSTSSHFCMPLSTTYRVFDIFNWQLDILQVTFNDDVSSPLTGAMGWFPLVFIFIYAWLYP